MASASTRVKVTFEGPYQLEFSVTFYVDAGIVDPTDDGIQAIIAAINAITCAVAVRIEISASAPHAVTPTASQVYVNEDKAQFVFKDAEGVPHNFKLPAPKPSIISDDDGTTIAVTGAVAAFTGAVAANAVGPNGSVLTAPSIGQRRASRKALKK